MPTGVYIRTKKTKQKMRQRMLNNKFAFGYKHSEEMNKRKSERQKGLKNLGGGMKGKRHSEETKEKIRMALTGKKHTEERRKNISIAHMGIQTKQNNSNWKGGITPLTEQIRKCFKYRQWRSDVFTRDNFTCIKCGEKGKRIEADHFPKKFSTIFSDNDIKTFDDAIVCEEFWNINNGRTLCVGCHRLKKEFIETRKETEKKAGTTIPIHPE